MSADSYTRPIAWKVIFVVVLVAGIPVGVAVRVYWIPHTFGAMGVGITIGYAVALAMMWRTDASMLLTRVSPSSGNAAA